MACYGQNVKVFEIETNEYILFLKRNKSKLI